MLNLRFRFAALASGILDKCRTDAMQGCELNSFDSMASA